LEETLLKKGFFQAIFPKFLKVLGRGFKGKTLFQKGFPLKLMTLPYLIAVLVAYTPFEPPIECCTLIHFPLPSPL